MIHTSWLWLHFIVYLALWVACWFIPDELFTIYLQAAMYISFFYLLLQLLFLLEFFFYLNKRFTDSEKICMPLTITIILSVIAIAVFSVDYYLFGLKGCSGNLAIISVNLIVSIILFVGSLIAEHGSILTASMIAAYVSYLTSMGLFCEGGTACNRLGGATSNIWLTITASVFTLCWACYSAYSSSSEIKTLMCCDDNCECWDTCCGLCEPKEDDAKEFSLSFFHLLFAMASVYVSMVVTSWGSSVNNAAPWSVDRGFVAKWTNCGAAWVTLVLYGWTLAAPYVLKDREFDY